MDRAHEVVIVGAGIAGLTAAAELSREGIAVVVVEARDRVGGRIFTAIDSNHHSPVELGAEFVHGRPREIWNLVEEHDLEIGEVEGDYWCVRNDRMRHCDFFSAVDRILKTMDDVRADESFREFLEREFPIEKANMQQREARERATSYVSGFNAADPALVGVHWLVQGMRAEEAIEGDRAFRLNSGYQQLVEVFRTQLSGQGVTVRTKAIVERVRWKKGGAELDLRTDSGIERMEAKCVLLTLPLAVLQARPGDVGFVEFVPALPERKVRALTKLEMGKVIRVSLQFRERFWEKIKPNARREALGDMSFLFSDDQWFPTWWTTMPQRFPIITGWAPFRSAGLLSGKPPEFVVQKGLATLGGLLRVDARHVEEMLETAFLHDWQSDPFARGAYSYGKVGSDGAQETLASPLEGTLFFAGEATDTTGHNGTVHGAMASAHRAAREIEAALHSRT